MAATQPFVRLNNGIDIPQIVLGCGDIWGDEARRTVETALQTGYRLLDTAAMYRNEAEVGAALKTAGLPRDEVFVVTIVHNTDQGYESTLRAYAESCRRLQLDYVDLYLVHWPIPGRRRDTWRALEKLYTDGAVRAIGVCNYLPPFLQELDTYANITPALNQCELSPYLLQRDLIDACRTRGIQLQAWAPLVRGKRFSDPRLQALANKYGKTPAQLLLRWAVDRGFSAIPKSASAERLRENFDLFDFALPPADLAAMDGFDEHFRSSGEDPMQFWR